MRRILFLITAGTLLLASCSPGNGEIQWTRLNPAPTADTPAIPVAATPAKHPVQTSSGGGRLSATGLSARITIGSVPMNASGEKMSVRNLTIREGN